MLKFRAFVKMAGNVSNFNNHREVTSTCTVKLYMHVFPCKTTPFMSSILVMFRTFSRTKKQIRKKL